MRKNAAKFLTFLSKGSAFAWRYVRNYFQKDRFTPRKVPSLSLETTNICNSKCVFCANPVMSRKKQQMSMDIFYRAVDQYYDMGGDKLDFNVLIGDPLLDKKLLERGHYARKKGFDDLGFVTTLQWLHKKDVDDLTDTFTWISISTVLSGRESYKKFFGVDMYDIMLKNLKTLIRVGKPKNMAIIIDIKPTDESIDTIINHPDFQCINEMMDGALTRSLKNRGYYVDDWQGAIELPPYLKKRPLYPRWRRPCAMLYNKLMVHSNGKVSLCACRDFNVESELVVGDLHKDRLDEIWNSPIVEKIRNDWRKKNVVPKICQSCSHYLY